MVIPELLAAIDVMDEGEQRRLADTLTHLLPDDDIQVTEGQQQVIRSRHEELLADPTLGLTRDQGRALLRKLVTE